MRKICVIRCSKKTEGGSQPPPQQGKVKVWFRYVDDTFVVMKGDLVGSLHVHLTSQVAGVAFTVEREKEGILPFLDVELRGEDGTVMTGVYRKTTHR